MRPKRQDAKEFRKVEFGIKLMAARGGNPREQIARSLSVKAAFDAAALSVTYGRVSTEPTV